jgi:hypothetical protein
LDLFIKRALPTEYEWLNQLFKVYEKRNVNSPRLFLGAKLKNKHRLRMLQDKRVESRVLRKLLIDGEPSKAVPTGPNPILENKVFL